MLWRNLQCNNKKLQNSTPGTKTTHQHYSPTPTPNTRDSKYLTPPNSGQKPNDRSNLLWNPYEVNLPKVTYNRQHFSLADKKIKHQLDNPSVLEPPNNEQRKKIRKNVLSISDAVHINSPYKARKIAYLTIVLMYFILIISGFATSLARPSTKQELSWKKKFLGI